MTLLLEWGSAARQAPGNRRCGVPILRRGRGFRLAVPGSPPDRVCLRTVSGSSRRSGLIRPGVGRCGVGPDRWIPPIEDPPTPGTILFSRADGNHLGPVSREGVPHFVTVGTQPILSPDRTRLLLRRLDGSPGGVILMRTWRPGREVPLYLNGTFCQGFSWFPDGGSVALDDFNLGPSLQGFPFHQLRGRLRCAHPWYGIP